MEQSGLWIRIRIQKGKLENNNRMKLVIIVILLKTWSKFGPVQVFYFGLSNLFFSTVGNSSLWQFMYSNFSQSFLFLDPVRIEKNSRIRIEKNSWIRNSPGSGCLDFRLRRLKTDLHLSTNHSTAGPNPDTHYQLKFTLAISSLLICTLPLDCTKRLNDGDSLYIYLQKLTT